MTSSTRLFRGIRWGALGAAAALLLALPASAHGPTVKVGHGRVQPPEIVIVVGQTVHFTNANSSGAPVTVVADDGSFESPTLGRAEGWHETFETAGEFPFSLRESSASGRIVVVPE